MRTVALAIAAAGWALGGFVSQQQPFRAATDAVALDVAVFEGGRVVSSLGPNDFEVYDNDVRQVVTTADRNLLPIDLRLVFDTSGSISAPELERHRRAMSLVTAALRPDDRCEIITFSGRIADAAAQQRPPIAVRFQRLLPDGTSFFDAVSLAMITLPTPERRQITIVLSDARDNASFFDEATLLQAARRTDAVVYGIVPVESPASLPFAARLEAVTLITGGRLLFADRPDRMGRLITEALDEFRQGYIVRYILTGVRPDGWHRVTVRVRSGRSYTVRAREGYFGR